MLKIGIPCVASFHTDILDLIRNHNANWFQEFCVVLKERVDSYVLDSCATTSKSFSVSNFVLQVYAINLIFDRV